MKILMTLESTFPPDKRVENEIDSLLKSGNEVCIICFGTKSAPKTSYYKTAKIYRINPANIIRKSSVAALKLPIYFSYWKIKLKQLFKKYNFDVVHVHDLPLIKPVLQLRDIYNFKVILDLHENWPGLLSVSPHTKTVFGKLLCDINQWEKYEKKFVPLSDKIIVVVNEAKNRLTNLSVQKSKIHIVSNTLNIQEVKDYSKKENSNKEKTIFIYEGGITYHRGIQYVLKALSNIEYSESNIEFRIIGDGSYLNNLKTISFELNLDNIVKFYGWQPLGKVFELLSEADIAIIPHIKSSHTDTTVPHKLFHYMYAGLPILASNCNPIERIIKETSAGYIYKYNDVDELTKQIKFILSNIKDLALIDAKEWVTKKYNWVNEEEALLKLYSKI